MKRALRLCLMVLLALVFVVSAGVLIYRGIQYRQGEETYQEAEKLAEIALPRREPDEADVKPAEAETLPAPNIGALQEVNADVLGWILIPDTAISYPLVQGLDNRYYLTHTWKRDFSAVGSIFMEMSNQPNFSDFHTILYGHHMKDGSMFAGLMDYKAQSHYAGHPAIYVVSGDDVRTYQIFAAYEADTQSETYFLQFPDEAARKAFLDACIRRSVITTGVTPGVDDEILTLSTCTGRGHATRWVVQAVCTAVSPAEDGIPPAASSAP